ncbi:hypothetical protein GGI25_002024 [Coemansia spiralis]|uniref:Uncharacterized protein n=2 Tax=Coemansia TaxID=4863 RepID=A0A9W8G4V6_9FUNG|nr:hypothetical protein EDC05_002634 [Coemansia umbellata]KAJ2623280.1 hypothetical protein GGI26_002507 [Coemansia sp. RSA 1358]KAJ2678832.1 hypothetical protein GGI25_002024 [Coemansia spiralis]
MRFTSTILAFALATFAAASPVVRRGNWVVDAYPQPAYPSYPGGGFPGGPGGGFPGGPGGGFPGGPGGGFPGGPGGGAPGGGNNGGNGGGNNGGNGGNDGGNNGGGNNGGNGGNNGGNGGNNGGNGGNNGGNGGNGGGNNNACGVTPNQISALTPLLNKLGLSTTVDGVKQLVKHVLQGVDGLLAGPAVNGSGGLIDLVNNLVKGLLGQPLDLHNTVTALVSILENQVPCLLDTILPKP